MKIKILLNFASIFTITLLNAQTSDKIIIASAGAVFSNTDTVLSYTIGEPIVAFVSNSSSIDQGFWAGSLQVENITEQKNLNGIEVYPNPVINELTIFTDDNEILGISLFGIDGRRVLNQSIENTQLEYKISTSHLSKGVYILRLFMEDDSKEKLFKIIKN